MGDDFLAEINLQIEKMHFDEEGLARGASQVGVADVSDSSVTGCQREESHEPQLLRLDRRSAPRRRRILTPNVAYDLGRSRCRNPCPEEGSDIGTDGQSPPLKEVLESLRKTLSASPESRLDPDDVKSGRPTCVRGKLSLDRSRQQVRNVIPVPHGRKARANSLQFDVAHLALALSPQMIADVPKCDRRALRIIQDLIEKAIRPCGVGRRRLLVASTRTRFQPRI